MTGIYQRCSEKHLHRYLAEFDFRYSNRIKLGIDDAMRAAKIVKGAKGKRLYYQASRSSNRRLVAPVGRWRSRSHRRRCASARFVSGFGVAF